MFYFAKKINAKNNSTGSSERLLETNLTCGNYIRPVDKADDDIQAATCPTPY